MTSDRQHINLLRQIWLFAELAEPELAAIAAVSRERVCSAGDVVVRQGDRSGSLYSVLRGRLKVTSLASDGDEILLGVMGPGDVFGEIALLDQEPRSASVTAAETGRLLEVSGAAFRQLLVEIPSLALRLLTVMASHVRRLSERTEDAAALDVRGRLAKRLLAIAERFGRLGHGNAVCITLKLSQRELGRLVGATREMVNRCLREWQRQKILASDGGTVTINSVDRLRAVADGEDDRLGPFPRRRSMVRIKTAVRPAAARSAIK